MASPPTSTTAVEATKDHRGENFPVASWLLARNLRGPVLAFYAYVRQADDIADSAVLSPEEKLARLDRLEAALDGADPSEPAAAALAAAGRSWPAAPEQARVMLDAFRQDAAKGRYADWDELVGYCERSANPVGRFLLRIHGEDPAAERPADALCTALQILNHLQDLVPDRANLNRIYLPEPWMARAGGEAAFFAPEPSPSRRAVLDAALERVGALIDEAEELVARLKSRRLAAESAVTVTLARRLAQKLAAADPVLGRVALSRADFAKSLAVGLAKTVRPVPDRALTRLAVSRSGSSFKLGMASLSGERRRAIDAVYAYCRVIDDIADGAAPVGEKQRFLAAWRREVDRLGPGSASPVARELGWAVERFGLPRDELHRLLDGMDTDAADQVRLPDDAALDRYCRQVAGAVGVLSIHIFGVPDALDFAVGLGRTLQIVNILRDIDEDAAIERVYVPLSRLKGARGDEPARDLVRHPDLAEVCASLAEEAARGFAEAERRLASLDRGRLRPAVLMMEAYRTLFERMRAQGWRARGERTRLSRADKLRLAWMALAPGRGTSAGRAS